MDSASLTTSGFGFAHHEWIRLRSPRVDSAPKKHGVEFDPNFASVRVSHLRRFRFTLLSLPSPHGLG